MQYAKSTTVKKIKESSASEMPVYYHNPSFFPPGLLADNTTDLLLWWEKVKDESDWDRKPQLAKLLNLERDKDYYFPIHGDPQHEYYYDIWSNIHYGYVARAAGFSEFILKKGSQANDTGKAFEKFLLEDAPKAISELSISEIGDAFNNLGNGIGDVLDATSSDIVSVQIGIDLWNKHGDKLRQEHI